MYYSFAEYFKVIQAAQIYQSDILIDFVTGQINIFRILCYLFDFAHLQCNRPLHTNFTTNLLHDIFTYIVHNPNMLHPHILAILRDLQLSYLQLFKTSVKTTVLALYLPIYLHMMSIVMVIIVSLLNFVYTYVCIYSYSDNKTN
jgi:hypothetical protein